MNKEGILLVNKSKNVLSFQLVKILRKITKIKKIGHAGTLDPCASGLMIMLIGKKYTKKASHFIKHDKEYLAKLHLGYITKSFDIEEDAQFVSDKIPTLEEIENVLKNFQGTIKQIPPMYSAKKINGQKLYNLARKNITIPRKPTFQTVATKLLDYSYPFLDLKIKCSKGTYIRSIANDIGNMLKCGAYLHALTRIKCGPFELKNAIKQECLNEKTDLLPFLIK